MSDEIRGLSLTQPYATLVAIGAKKIETRSWATSYRGLLAIHASKKFPGWAQDTIFTEPFKSVLRTVIGKHGALVGGDELELPVGKIVAVARLWHIVSTNPTGTFEPSMMPLPGTDERAFGDYSRGRQMWFLKDVRALQEPVPCRGALGTWDVPADVVAQIEAQIGGLHV